ncbi:MAG: substrate-binding domain-containing protein [Acidobacteria bacterium]|nr:substrate-binding domain-containing protein [Acidobacteriota bacterium]
MSISWGRLARRKWANLSVATALAVGGAVMVSNGVSSASSQITIGFSQGITLNSYHQVMVASFEQAANTLKSEGKISGYSIASANGNASTQVSQINALILKHVSVLVIDPASPSALNASIQRATNAGIPVLVFNDGPVTTKAAYELNFNFAKMMKQEATYIAQRLHGKGNVLEVRGQAGTASDVALHQGVIQGFKPYPGIKIVSSVYGNWDNSSTQSAVAKVLPSLPAIAAEIDQGGETYGAIQAFLSGGRSVPLVVFGNRGLDLKWWANYRKTHPSFTTESASANPGIGSVVPYIAYHLAAKDVKVPKNMDMPVLWITQSTLSKYLNTPTGGVAHINYNDNWVKSNLLK